MAAVTLKKPKVCFFCEKEIETAHAHSLASIPPYDQDVLFSSFKKDQTEKAISICCIHFAPHDDVFRFSATNYPGLCLESKVNDLELFLFT